MADGLPSTDELVRRYRERQAAQDTDAPEPGSEDAPIGPPGPQEAPSPGRGEPPRPAPSGGPPPTQDARPPVPRGPEAWGVAGADAAGEPGAERPAEPAAEPWREPAADARPETHRRPDPEPEHTVALGAAARELHLLPRLTGHALVAPRGSPALRTVGLVLVVLGLLVLLVERRAALLGEDLPDLPVDLFLIAGATLLIGALAWLVAFFTPPRRRVQLRLFASQQDEWVRAVALATRQRVLHAVALVLLLAGLSGLVVRYHLGGDIPDLHLAALGGLAVIGALLLLVAAARWRLARWGYVQTLVLAWVEQSGAFSPSGPDPEVREVLHAVASFIRQLPEGHRRQFEASGEAQRLDDLLSR